MEALRQVEGQNVLKKGKTRELRRVLSMCKVIFFKEKYRLRLECQLLRVWLL